MTSTQGTDTETHSKHGGTIEPKTNMASSINKLRCLNDALPIHQLPIELLLSIFGYVLRTGATASIYYRRICALSGVCARWLLIIQHSPALWTTVAVSIKEEGLSKILERSSGKLIDVEYEPQDGETLRYPEGSFMESFNILSSTTGRWRTLILETWHYSGDRPSEFLQFPAPNLERLVFRNNNAWDMKDVELFGGHCPNLKHIHLDQAECNWSQAAFKGLESLELSYMSFDTIEPILAVIRDIPPLERLEIHDCDVREDVPANTQPISLPNLQFLRAEFDDYGLTCATKQLLNHISAPPPCPLYVSLAYYDDEEGSFVDTFCEWIFGRQTKEILEGLESFNLGFGVSEDDLEDSLNFELHSGFANISGGVRGFREEDVQYILEYIQGLFQRSHSSKPFTKLRLSGRGVELLNDTRLITPFKDLPPITHLELVEPVWSFRNPSEDVHNGSELRTASPFSTVKSFILREVSPDNTLDIVLGALGDRQTRSHSMSELRVGNLDHVEVHVEETDFIKVEAVVEVLRNDSRIGKVDLYVTL